MDSVCYERIIICGFNLFSHYLYIEQLYWIMPYNGDEAPDIGKILIYLRSKHIIWLFINVTVIFFRDSMLITGLMVLITVVMKHMNTNQERPAMWIETTTDFLVRNRVGVILLVNENKGTLDSESLDVVEQHKKISRHNITWKSFAGIVDRILFIAVLVAYILMFISLLPGIALKCLLLKYLNCK